MTGQALQTAWLLAPLVAGGLALYAVVNLVLGVREVVALRRLLVTIVGSTRIDQRQQLVELQAWLRERIRWVPGSEHRRPMLRDTATRILATGHGFCGENARVGSLLLNLGGVPARRLYLEGPRWGHVLIEHRWGSSWVAFDAHADPGVILPPESLGNIPSERLDLLPNAYSDTNPWVRSYRLQLPRRLPRIGPRLGQIRLPAFASVIAESPWFIWACLALAAAIGLLVLTHWARP